MIDTESSAPSIYQHEKEYEPTGDKQYVHKPVNDVKTIRFGVEENEVISFDDWNKRWENTHAGRWQLAAVHPFLLKHASLFRDWHDRANKSILVPLCGKSDDLFWLAQEAGLKQVIGIESSSIAITSLLTEYEYSRVNEKIGRYTALDGKLSIFCADFFDDDVNQSLLGGAVDYVWDRAALVALHWKDHERYVRKLSSLQAAPKREQNDKFDILIGAYWHSQHRGPPFDVDLKYLRKVFGFGIEVQQLDEVNAFYSGWENGGFTDMFERLYGVQLPTANALQSAK
jgi:thiopurine S-methyltransferase